MLWVPIRRDARHYNRGCYRIEQPHNRSSLIEPPHMCVVQDARHRIDPHETRGFFQRGTKMCDGIIKSKRPLTRSKCKASETIAAPGISSRLRAGVPRRWDNWAEEIVDIADNRDSDYEFDAEGQRLPGARGGPSVQAPHQGPPVSYVPPPPTSVG
jgi:hypothetical protein